MVCWDSPSNPVQSEFVMSSAPVFDLEQANAPSVIESDDSIIRHALQFADGKAMISTNFRPQEAVLLHKVTRLLPDITVLWVDHGYNTPDTYRFAEQLIAELELNVALYLPKRTAAHREAVSGGIPSIDDVAAHDAFTQEVKLEPFRRGLAELAPTVWFTALRREQTAFRAGMRHFELEANNLIKVSPLLDWDNAAMEAYLAAHNLPDERTYFDPTKLKAPANAACIPIFIRAKGSSPSENC